VLQESHVEEELAERMVLEVVDGAGFADALKPVGLEVEM
jgi:hypothetical protein